MKEKISNVPSLRTRRRILRRDATPQEVILWSRLRNERLGCKFRRQHSFGKYVADFYCREKSLIVEVDGSQHIEQEGSDLKKTRFFESRGLRVLRVWNNEINGNLVGVLAKIMESLEP